MTPRPFRFLAEAVRTGSGRELADAARRAESAGYAVLVFTDHLLDQLAPLAAMATAAAVTERLRVGTFVLNNDLRHPAVLAHELATIDRLSGGRLEIGLGAGWNRPEYEAIGLPFDPPAVRVSRLVESVAVLKGLLGTGAFSFEGAFYRIAAGEDRLAPVQRPHPPLMIGSGSRRMLSLAGREAQIASLAPRPLPTGVRDPRSITWEGTLEKVGWVRDAAGPRAGEIELNVYPVADVTVTDRALPLAREIAHGMTARSGIEISAEEVLESPNILIGSIESLTAKLQRLRDELGISSIMVGEPGPLDAIVERLAGS